WSSKKRMLRRTSLLIMALQGLAMPASRRGRPLWTTPAVARALAAGRAGALAELAPVQCSFLLMPYMHSESAAIHVLADTLYRDHAPATNHEFELKHKAIIDRFGRYPHRNAILGREPTPEETAFLQQPGSSF
ncbi:MAG: DUF924 domain-containing protein, partial [Arenimonas sp.]|uniref:DUF924 family protein n=1 Tax=Arenimonas sp. TaxID=1872635 RepID=UPI0025C1C34B